MTVKSPSRARATRGYVNYTDKINAAYSLGGPELAIRTLNQNFGLDIRDDVTVNFAYMAAIVDAFGGVNITMTGEEVYQLNANLWALSQEVEDERKREAPLPTRFTRRSRPPTISPM